MHFRYASPYNIRSTTRAPPTESTTFFLMTNPRENRDHRIPSVPIALIALYDALVASNVTGEEGEAR